MKRNKMFSGKPSQAQFAEMVRRAFEAAGFAGLEYREEEFALKMPGRETTIFLSNLYSNYCNAPRKHRQEVIDKLIAGIGSVPDIPANFAAARPNLMPAVRDAAYESLSELLPGRDRKDPEFMWAYKPLTGDLVVGVVYDTEHNISSLPQKNLAEWGVSLDEALAAAKENLWDRTDPNKFNGAGGVYVGEWGDSYDSSRILLTEFIYRLDVDGDPVAYVPNRDSLMVTGKRNTSGLQVLLKVGGENHFKAGHPVSPDLYVLEDGVWKTYIPEDASLREMWKATRRNRDGLDYQHQKKLLEKVRKDDVFIANFMMFKQQDGSGFSACVWAKDVDTSLPRAEFLGFAVSEDDQFMVSWDAAVAVVGKLMQQEEGLVPVRYRVREFPSDAQVAELRKLAASGS